MAHENRISDRSFFWLSIALFAAILIRPYFHYLVLALPFIALLCARPFRDREKGDRLPATDSVRFK